MEYLTTECQLIIGYIIENINRYNTSKNESEQVPLTIKRIQSILYLSHIEYIKRTGDNLLEDEFHAWQYGPAIPAVYNKYLAYTTNNSQIIKFPQGKLNIEKENIINSIITCTNHIDTYELNNICHYIDDLWKRYYNPYDKSHRQIIKKHDILIYHRKKSKNSIIHKLKKI